ncbi:hypothetical protein BG418_09085 [Streptomyces sp. CBMA152]|nr:hypothetical protein [Streptomyces sp. CBMA152]
MRQSIDEVLDGQRTGRFDINELEKTEKTYLGTKVEIIVRSAFDLGRGGPMDYRIAGHDVDAKWTSGATWTIPREAMGHLCLLMSADDYRSAFQVGLVRITDEVLTLKPNGDGKRAISSAGKSAIRWLIPKAEGALPVNVLLDIPVADREAIFHASDGYRGSGNGGQLRINELLRRAQGRIIDRNTALTVASQDDGPKRVRDARKLLRPEGIVVLGHQNDHPRIARELGLPVPAKGTWVAVRLAIEPPGGLRPGVDVQGTRYVIAQNGDVPAAPDEY